MPNGCPFCDIEDRHILFSNEHVFAVWDQFPVAPGHLLIITRRHFSDWFDALEQEQVAILNAISEGRKHIISEYPASGFNIGVNIGTVAGQTVPHLHVHLIPRNEGDTPDPTGGVRHVIPSKGNYKKRVSGFNLFDTSSNTGKLTQGLEDPFLPQLTQCLDDALQVDFAVAFIMRSGVNLIRNRLIEILQRGGKIRILTGDYMNATDPDALLDLMHLEGDIELKVFDASKTSFHPKAYVFYDNQNQGTAFVGSSNLSKTALKDGVEWNYRILRETEDQGFSEIAAGFEKLFSHPNSQTVDQSWIDKYRLRRGNLDQPEDGIIPDEAPEKTATPHQIQREALAALSETRDKGNQAGLVVLATGLGKTWLAAFDSDHEKFKRVLFVAHREEILSQAMQTFRRIRPTATLGRYTGKEKSPDAEILFASIQTLGRMHHLKQFDRTRFDYIIVDEFHHAAARTYRQLINYFTPAFLLGLTATPERMDGGDLLALCQENLVYRKDVIEGIKSGLLCPFNYFGVPDEVDYAAIPWRNSRFDAEELTNAVATQRRAENAFEQLQKRGGKRTLGFCCSQRHADFMADFFTERGIKSVAVHAGENSAPRTSALQALEEGKLDVVFAVDMFNEGLDIPNIDTVLMLRPTQSSTIWIQQFGRGLRKAEGKSELKVIDYIGNHRTFLVKIRSLLQPLMGIENSDAAISAALRLLQKGEVDLPDGCNVTYDLESIDIIKPLLRLRAVDDAIQSFYEDFKERVGIRPTAVETYHSGYNPRSLKKTHGSWTRFVNSNGDCSNSEQEAIKTAGEFIDNLEKTPMTKSFKMVTLLALLNLDSLTSATPISNLTEEFKRIACRREALRSDVGDALSDDKQLEALIVKNPIAAFCGGKGTGNRSYFKYENDTLLSNFEIPENGTDGFQTIVREIAEWRLAEYLNRPGKPQSLNSFTCKIIHSNGRPIAKLPDRNKTPGIPFGPTSIVANNKNYEANFVKEFLNVVKLPDQQGDNVLAEILRGWFGASAGQPGTRHQIEFELEGDTYKMLPVNTTEPNKAKLWSHYMRKDIAPLFGLVFNTGNWRQGFVNTGSKVFLLVTLDKDDLNQEYGYEDHFLKPNLFHWQSQNRTKQDSKHGRMIRDHISEQIDINLFIRKRKKLDGKAAPFIYCGPVEFQSWRGEKPISVKWKLSEPVPPALWSQLGIKTSGESLFSE